MKTQLFYILIIALSFPLTNIYGIGNAVRRIENSVRQIENSARRVREQVTDKSMLRQVVSGLNLNEAQQEFANQLPDLSVLQAAQLTGTDENLRQLLLKLPLHNTLKQILRLWPHGNYVNGSCRNINYSNGKLSAECAYIGERNQRNWRHSELTVGIGSGIFVSNCDGNLTLGRCLQSPRTRSTPVRSAPARSVPDDYYDD
jgi:hypothetical protein